MAKFKERDVVRLINDNYQDVGPGIRRETKGVIIAVYASEGKLDGENEYEVEFQDDGDGNIYDPIVVSEKDLDLFSSDFAAWASTEESGRITPIQDRFTDFPQKPTSDAISPFDPV